MELSPRRRCAQPTSAVLRRGVAAAGIGLLFTSATQAQQAAPLQLSPGRDEIRSALQQVEVRIRQCSPANAGFLSRVSFDSSGRAVTAEVFAPSQHASASREGDMGFDRHPVVGQKAWPRLGESGRACVLRELRSLRVAPFALRRFVVFALMEINHGTPTAW